MEHFKKIAILQSTSNLAIWDQHTYMPPQAVSLRAEQLALLGILQHEYSTTPVVKRLLTAIQRSSQFKAASEIERRNIELCQKSYEKSQAVPEELISQLTKQKTQTTQTWGQAKYRRDFSLVKFELEKLFSLTEQYGQKLAVILNTEEKTCYDALLDEFEPKITIVQLKKIFSELKTPLIAMTKKLTHDNESIFAFPNIDIDIQKAIRNKLLSFLGHDQDHCRVDESLHPFTIGNYPDVRITARYNANSSLGTIFAVLHESGHAIYSLNYNREHEYEPVFNYCSLGIHESQSRFLENIIGRSPEFWEYFLPEIRKLVPTISESLSVSQLVKRINQVKPSLVRTAADEITYNLHILIRFELEEALFDQKISIAELPAVWNEKYREYLNLDVPDDSSGILQDVHWYQGMFGYFPTYTLGNLYSAQMLSTMEKELPDWRSSIKRGQFDPIKLWLIRNVHQYGNLYDPNELIVKITGEKITTKYFLKYLSDKYRDQGE